MTSTIDTQSLLTQQFDSTAGSQSLADYKGHNIVLYFYPKDNTSGCTQESSDFRDHKVAFDKLNTVILGVSRDSLKSHHKFITDHDLNFTLISDPDEILCNLCKVMQEKSMYGRRYMGIERSTFLFDTNGNLVNEWRKVKVAGHVAEVLCAVQQL